MVLQALNECRRQRLAAPRTGTASGFDPHRIVTNRSIRLVLAIATETNGLLVLVVLVNNESFGFGYSGEDLRESGWHGGLGVFVFAAWTR